jgi:hypothetical protein
MQTLTFEIIPTEILYEPDLTRSEVAKELGISTKTVERYIKLGALYIADLQKYITGDISLMDTSELQLNGTRLLSSDLVYLEEIKDLKSRFAPQRVEQILARKYQTIAE